jgi:hypothetical protein
MKEVPGYEMRSMRMLRMISPPAAVVLCGLLVASACADSTTPQSFPLTPGTYWIYRGLERYTVVGSNVVKMTRVTWRMSVERAIQREGLLAVVIRGFPGDLDWSDGHVKPSPSILFRTDDEKFYLSSASDTSLTLSQLGDPKFAVRGLLQEDDWFLQLPLAAGKRFCEREGMERPDGHYCWLTGRPRLVALDSVKGLVPAKRVAYKVEYFTNPDEIEFDFVPGVGMTSYSYHHHGTIADTELHLVEFHVQP